MIEFGEKLKQLREEKGMTQQTLADMLYVTRQAVSRWECGARYPDLITTKKISQILGVTIDELVSGEKLKENIENKPILVPKRENVIQIVMYTMIAAMNILQILFAAFAYWDDHVQFGRFSYTIMNCSMDLERIVTMLAALCGIYISSKDKMTARITGCILCIPYIFTNVNFCAFVAEYYRMGAPGELIISSWFFGLVLPLLMPIYILMYFFQKKRSLPYYGIVIICLYSIILELRFLVNQLISMYTYGLADPVFVFTNAIVGLISAVLMSCLLWYQAFKWNKSKLAAIKYK